VNVSYKTCGPMNCIGEVAFSDAWLKAFREATSFVVSYTFVNGKKFEHEVSLKGFSDAFNYYTEQANTVSGQ
jgi:invasion protein IalB